MKEREISLIDLLFEVLLKWRIIILFMIIGGLLLGGYSYMQSAQTIEQQAKSELSDAERLALLEETLTEGEKDKVNMALEYANYETYYKESVLMQIDANNVPTMELLFDVQAPDEIKGKLVSVYGQMFQTGISEWLIQNGTDAIQASKVNELIGVGQFEDIWIDPNEFHYVYIDQTDKCNCKGFLYVYIIHTDEFNCKELAETVKLYMEAQQMELVKEYGEHELILVNESYATLTNTDILNKQRDALVKITDSNSKIAALEKEFTEAQQQYFALLRNAVKVETEDVETESEAVEFTPNPTVSIKYVAIGVVLFAFIYICFVFLTYIFNNKLRVNDDFTALYDIPQLGVIIGKDVKKKFLGFVDAFILRLRNRNKREFTMEESKEIASVAIKVAAKKSESNEVYLIGCDLKNQADNICTDIQNVLKEDNIRIEIIDNILYNAEEMDKLTNVQCAVLVEKAGSTMYEEVEKELELLKRNNVNVLGGILIK